MERITQIIPAAINDLTEQLTTANTPNLCKATPVSEFSSKQLEYKTFLQGIAMIETDKNLNLEKQKINLLWNNLKNYKELTFKNMVKNILSSKLYNNLTLNDFLETIESMPKFENKNWYLKMIKDFPGIAIDIYEDLQGNSLYKFSNGKFIKYPNLIPIYVNGKYTVHSFNKRKEVI